MTKAALSSFVTAGQLGLLLLAAPHVASGQTRPLLTEEAATAPMGSLIVEVGQAFIGNEPNFLTGGRRDRWDGPLVRLVYSPGDAVEVDLEWTTQVCARDDPDLGDVSDFGDVVLRAKVRFVEEQGGRPGLAARFGVSLPQTRFGEGLGPNTLRMSAGLLLSRGLWAGGRAHINAGLALHDEPLRAHEQRDFLAYGLAVEQRAGGRLVFVGELAGLAGDGKPGADARSEARLGVRLGSGRLRWDAAVRHGLAQADGDWGFTAGLRWRLR